MDCNFIGLNKKSVVGINNPILKLTGIIRDNDLKFIVLADGKDIYYALNIVNKEGYFELSASFNNSVKVVKVYILKDNKKYLVCEIKNNVFTRIAKTILYYIFNFLKKVIFGIFKTIIYIFVTLYKGIKIAWKEHHFLIPPALWGKYFKALINKIIYPLDRRPYFSIYNVKEYNKWLKKHLNEETIIKEFKYKPLISIVIPVYNIEEKLLMECINSILNQTYNNYEICIADDNSTNEETINTLKKLETMDSRIKIIYRKKNGHISEATNSAISITNGEFIAFMDDDDLITPNALYEVVKSLNENPNIDMIYSDEDKMEMDGTFCEPNFKPDFSPDTLLGGNYICHLCVCRKSLFKETGLLRTEYNGAQDFDFVLRFSEKTENIYHIPKILYHWRKVPGSTAVSIKNKGYAIENGKKAVEDALKRRKIEGKVIVPIESTNYIIEYDIVNNPLVSIIIPTKDDYKTFEKCLSSIYSKTKYKNYEVIVINNQSCEEKTFSLFDEYKNKYKNFRVIDANYEFNYSKMNNDAVSKSKGEYIILLNNDTEVISKNWIDVMLGYAQQKYIGAVGVKLLYPNNTIQHGGIILGLGGLASHAFIGEDKNSYGIYGRLLIPYNYSAVTAACLMVKKQKYMEVNGLDEKLEVAYNDVDFNLKLLKKGYYNIFLPQVELFHYESKTRGLDTTSKKYKKYLEESDYLKKRWNSYLINDKYYNPNYSLVKDFYIKKQ